MKMLLIRKSLYLKNKTEFWIMFFFINLYKICCFLLAYKKISENQNNKETDKECFLVD